MNQWLDNELAGTEDDFQLLIAVKTSGYQTGTNYPVEPEDLIQWKADKGLGDCPNCVFVDGDLNSGGFATWDKFVNANPDFYYTAGIPMVIDKTMTIREISGTYEWDTYPLSTIQELLSE